MVLAKLTLRQYEEDSHSTTPLPHTSHTSPFTSSPTAPPLPTYYDTSTIPPSAQDLADDEDLVKLKLYCTGLFFGNRPPEDSLNTAMLQAAQEVDINHYYKELPHFVSTEMYG